VTDTATTETTETGETGEPSTRELAGRIDGINAKLDALIDKLGSKSAGAHAAAEQHTEDRLDRPTTIADQIRQQLEEQRAADAETAEKRGQADRLAAVEQRLAGMAEATPAPPERRIEKILGWRG
jgi:hypothetical protein